MGPCLMTYVSFQTVLASIRLEDIERTLFFCMCAGLLQGEVCACGTTGRDKATQRKQMFLYWVKRHWQRDNVCVPKGLPHSVGVLHSDVLQAEATICHL